MAFSLRPSTFIQGGLIDDLDAEIIRARFVSYDFEGKSSDGAKLCALLLLKDADGNEYPQYFSAGDLQYFVPSEDPKNADLNGITIVTVGDKTALNGSTNTALMLSSLVQAGFPEDMLDGGDLRVLEGLVGHWNRVPQPKRNNLPVKPGQDSNKVPMVLVCTAIKSMPGEPKPTSKPQSSGGKTSPATGKSQVASNPQSTASQASTASDDVKSELTGELIGLFATEGVQSMKKVDITRKLFASIDKTNPNKQKMMSIVTKDDILKSLEGFTYNGSVLTQE